MESANYGTKDEVWEKENLLDEKGPADDVELSAHLREKKQSATQLNRYLIIGLAALATLVSFTAAISRRALFLGTSRPLSCHSL